MTNLVTREDANDDGFAAYMQLRQRAPGASPADSLRARIKQTEVEVHGLQGILGHECRQAVKRDQGLLFAWAHLRVACQRELEDVARQPWLRELTLGADGIAVRIVAGLSEGQHRLVIAFRADATRQIQIHKPPLLPKQDTPLFRSALHGLFAEGRLADAVSACAQRLGLSLASRPASQAVVVPGDGESRLLPPACRLADRTRDPLDA